MDGKGSYSDNLFIERLWRTVKYEEVYFKVYRDGNEARADDGSGMLARYRARESSKQRRGRSSSPCSRGGEWVVKKYLTLDSPAVYTAREMRPQRQLTESLITQP